MSFIGVEIFTTKKTVYILTNKRDFKVGEWCVFEIQDGFEIGKIKFCVEKELNVQGTNVRKATLKDIEEFRKRENIAKKAKDVALEKIEKYKLPMKLILTKYPLGRKKIIFYYTAKERVDFRQLVKELAGIFKVRIQMQQIGVRDEPQIMGGIGICGREVCCASFLGKSKDKLDPVALEAARIQNLPLVSSKISGICGRLRCCLNFEYNVYSDLIKGFPKVGDEINLQGEKVKVVGCNLLKRLLIIETSEGMRKIVTEDEINKE